MYEEPYRWVEAVGNRRQYLDEQFKQGSPVVALTYDDGMLLLTVSKGTPKLYEIYDRIALAGMGHPADLEKLRFSLLEMAHIEGFNRSPSDVTGTRLVKYGIAPIIKQAFEEVFKAPFIVKILLAELGAKPEKDAFLTINYDGTFEEARRSSVLAAASSVERRMKSYMEQDGGPRPLKRAVDLALRTWAVGDRAQQSEKEDGEREASGDSVSASTPRSPSDLDAGALWAHLRTAVSDKTVECAVLERHRVGTSKYRALPSDELTSLFPQEFRP